MNFLTDSKENLFDRRLVVLGAVIVQLCIGSLYAWSAFKAALKEATTYNLSDWDATLPFSIGLFSFSIFMIVAGRVQDKYGPMKVSMTGGILLAVGYILAGMVDILGLTETTFPSSTLWLVLTYGVIAGGGSGVVYVCPIAALVKWFPDIKGTITGVAVAGFGAGAILFFYVEEFLIDIGNGNIGLAFFILGLVYLIGIIGGSYYLRNPPEGWLPEGFTPPPKPAVTGDKQDYEWIEMLKTPQFYLLWFMFVIAASAGLMTISNISPFTKQFEFLIPLGLSAPWLVMTMYSIFNAGGRIAWGMVSERIGRIMTMIVMFSILGVTMILFGGFSDLLLIILGAATIGFCFGGNFALFPSTTADYFGSKNIGLNYALVFTAYGIAGIFGPLLAAGLEREFGGYGPAFTLLGLLAFVAVGLAVISEYINRKAQATR